MKLKKIIYSTLSALLIACILYFGGKTYYIYFSEKVFARRCLTMIENNDLKTYKKLLYQPTEQILINNKQYKYFIMSFYNSRAGFLKKPKSKWKTKIISMNRFPPEDLYFGRYSAKFFPQPSFIIKIYSNSNRYKVSFNLYAKSIPGNHFRLVYPLVTETHR